MPLLGGMLDQVDNKAKVLFEKDNLEEIASLAFVIFHSIAIEADRVRSVSESEINF